MHLNKLRPILSVSPKTLDIIFFGNALALLIISFLVLTNTVAVDVLKPFEVMMSNIIIVGGMLSSATHPASLIGIVLTARNGLNTIAPIRIVNTMPEP